MKESRTLDLSEVLHSTTDIIVPFSLVEKISEQRLPTLVWLYKTIKLGLMIEESEVYQEVGINREMSKLRVYNNYPYPVYPSEETLKINIPQKYLNRIQKCLEFPSLDNTKNWIRRTYFLGLNHQDMNIFQKTETGYERIVFDNINISDIK